MSYLPNQLQETCYRSYSVGSTRFTVVDLKLSGSKIVLDRLDEGSEEEARLTQFPLLAQSISLGVVSWLWTPLWITSRDLPPQSGLQVSFKAGRENLRNSLKRDVRLKVILDMFATFVRWWARELHLIFYHILRKSTWTSEMHQGRIKRLQIRGPKEKSLAPQLACVINGCQRMIAGVFFFLSRPTQINMFWCWNWYNQVICLEAVHKSLHVCWRSFLDSSRWLTT